jgi:hypothetical protein
VNNLPQDNNKKLVDFVRQNYPVLPSSAEVEEQLMQKIERHSLRHNKYRYGLLVVIPSAMVTGAFLTWNETNLRLGSVSVTRHNSEIEDFLVNSWTNTLDYEPRVMTDELDSYLFSSRNTNAKNLSLSSP